VRPSLSGVSAHPAGAGLARLVARAQRRYQHAQAHRKRIQVLIGAVDTHGRTTTPPSSTSGDGCWATKSSLLTVAAPGCC